MDTREKTAVDGYVIGLDTVHLTVTAVQLTVGYGYGRTVDGRIRLRLSRPPSVNLLPKIPNGDGTVTVQP